MGILCEVNTVEYETVEEVHKCLRKFKVKQSDYYEDNFPRFDLSTGEKISYKNYDQYWSQDFLKKNNIKKFIKEKPDEAKIWAIDWLKRRKENKGLSYAFSQIELKSLTCPTMLYYDSVGGYYNIAKELGFKRRYLDKDLKFTPLLDSTVIIQDSREQKPLKFKYKTIVEKVNCGDYAIKDSPYDVYIERKSLGDFIGTLSGKNLERFERELQRARDNKHYVVMLVESKLTQALSFDYLPHINKHTRITPSHIFKNLRDLLQKYPLSFQAVFVTGRTEAQEKAIKIFELGAQAKKVDLEYCYEKGLL